MGVFARSQNNIKAKIDSISIITFPIAVDEVNLSVFFFFALLGFLK